MSPFVTRADDDWFGLASFLLVGPRKAMSSAKPGKADEAMEGSCPASGSGEPTSEPRAATARPVPEGETPDRAQLFRDLLPESLCYRCGTRQVEVNGQCESCYEQALDDIERWMEWPI